MTDDIVDSVAENITALNINEERKEQSCTAVLGEISKGPIIICDAWYGFPIQARPRLERIRAVAKQIYNFVIWKYKFIQEKKIPNNACSMAVVIGEKEDIIAVQERVEEWLEKSTELKDASYFTLKNYCIFLPGQKLEDLSIDLSNFIRSRIEESQSEDTQTIQSNCIKLPSIAYLSPDADESIPANQTPPKHVIVGMLVDRKVQPNRSKSRAEAIQINDEEQCMSIETKQLPLKALNVSDLSQDEPLNIDTVMEMMERWWINVKYRDGSSESKRVLHFRDAAARSLLTHRQRHPNRTIHGGSSQS